MSNAIIRHGTIYSFSYLIAFSGLRNPYVSWWMEARVKVLKAVANKRIPKVRNVVFECLRITKLRFVQLVSLFAFSFPL